jgi:hypothetical protein
MCIDRSTGRWPNSEAQTRWATAPIPALRGLVPCAARSGRHDVLLGYASIELATPAAGIRVSSFVLPRFELSSASSS